MLSTASRGRSLLAAALLTLLIVCLCGIVPARAAGVTVDIQPRVQGTYTGANGLGSPVFTFREAPLLQLAPGTLAAEADKLFADSRTLAASATENLDLAGTLTDPLGAALTFGHVKAIYIRADPANTNNVVIGGGTNAFVGPFGGTTPTIALQPGAFVVLTAPGTGWPVTATTADLLKVANSGAGSGVTYDVIIIGTSS